MQNHSFMRIAIRCTLVAAACTACLVAYAQSAVGNWTGKMDFSQIKPKDAKEKQQVDMARQMLAKTSIQLTFKSDKTYAITFAGGPTGSKPTTETGKWSQKGRTITVLDKKGKPETLTIDSKGKTMTMVPPADQGAPKGFRLLFSKA
jgi:hypothetical protein